ncbi:MAG TPA: hypothetical protein VN442_03720 [Bryobacteraceae bacterium]|nr:hypothetical protein [Bryobacteraceae bacterium]
MAFNGAKAGLGIVLLAGLLFGPALEAQDRGRMARRGWSPVDRAMSDLNRAARNGRYLDGHEREHFDRAMQELGRFEDRWRDGRFDKGRLDKGIENIQHLVNSDRLHPADRRMLARDLAELRDFRARGGYDPGGYGRDGYGRDGYGRDGRDDRDWPSRRW